MVAWNWALQTYWNGSSNHAKCFSYATAPSWLKGKYPNLHSLGSRSLIIQRANMADACHDETSGEGSCLHLALKQLWWGSWHRLKAGAWACSWVPLAAHTSLSSPGFSPDSEADNEFGKEQVTSFGKSQYTDIVKKLVVKDLWLWRALWGKKKEKKSKLKTNKPAEFQDHPLLDDL